MAIYTHITAESLTQYLAQFDIGRLVSFTGITEGIENTNYKLVTTKGPFILTLFEKRVKPEDLPFFVALMEHLHRKGIPCPDVVCDNTGEKIVRFEGKPAIITTFLEGAWPRQIEDFHVEAVGKILAEMHLAGGDFGRRRSNALALPAWRMLIDLCVETADDVSPGIFVLLQEELAYLEKNWSQKFPIGPIHGDLFPDNVFFSGRDLGGVIDFYFSCTDILAYDLMLTLNAWCLGKEGVPDHKKSTAFLSAYESVRPLSADESAALPFFGRAAALRILATRLYDWLHPVEGAVVQPKDPLEYLKILQFYRDGGMSA